MTQRKDDRAASTPVAGLVPEVGLGEFVSKMLHQEYPKSWAGFYRALQGNNLKITGGNNG